MSERYKRYKIGEAKFFLARMDESTDNSTRRGYE
jgi:hypothetical protein